VGLILSAIPQLLEQGKSGKWFRRKNRGREVPEQREDKSKGDTRRTVKCYLFAAKAIGIISVSLREGDHAACKREERDRRKRERKRSARSKRGRKFPNLSKKTTYRKR